MFLLVSTFPLIRKSIDSWIYLSRFYDRESRSIQEKACSMYYFRITEPKGEFEGILTIV